MTAVTYTSPWGRTWEFLENQWSTALQYGGIEGMQGSIKDNIITAVGMHGQVLESQDVEPMTGSLTLVVRARDGKTFEQIMSELRSGFSRKRAGTLSIMSSRRGRVSAQVRLAGVIDAPKCDPEDQDIEADIKIPLVCDQGVWWMDYLRGTGTVSVTNPGDVMVWPRIRWMGAGGQVTLPSGATFTLPPTAAERLLLLDPSESCVVLTPENHTDYDLWSNINALPEGIPDGQTRTYVLPDGATLEWSIGVIDAWK